MRRPAKREEAIQQVCDYLTGFALGEKGKHQSPSDAGLFPEQVPYSQEEEEKLAANVGLATDGERFVFVQRLAQGTGQA